MRTVAASPPNAGRRSARYQEGWGRHVSRCRSAGCACSVRMRLTIAVGGGVRPPTPSAQNGAYRPGKPLLDQQANPGLRSRCVRFLSPPFTTVTTTSSVTFCRRRLPRMGGLLAEDLVWPICPSDSDPLRCHTRLSSTTSHVRLASPNVRVSRSSTPRSVVSRSPGFYPPHCYQVS